MNNGVENFDCNLCGIKMVTQVLRKIAIKLTFLHQQGRVWIITLHFAYCEVNLNFLEKKMCKNKHLRKYGNFCRFPFLQKLELSINWVRSPQSTPLPMYLPLNIFVHYNDGLTCSYKTFRLSELCYHFTVFNL